MTVPFNYYRNTQEFSGLLDGQKKNVKQMRER